MLASFPKMPKTWRPKALKIDVFDYPTVVWRPISREPLANIRINLYYQKLESLGYVFVADTVGLFSFTFSWWAPKDACVFWNRVHNSHLRSSNFVNSGTNRTRVCDLLLIMNSNLGHILPSFRDIAGFLRWRATPPLFHPNFGGVPLGLDCRYCVSQKRRP